MGNMESGPTWYDPSEDVDTYGDRLIEKWAVELAEGKCAKDLLRHVEKDYAAVNQLRSRFSVGSRHRQQAMSILAWQSTLLACLHMRDGGKRAMQVRQWANQARVLGYQCRDLHAVAQAYDKEAIFELWYGSPEKAITMSTRGLQAVGDKNPTVSHALLKTNIMRGYAAIGDVDAFKAAERAALESVDKLSPLTRPSAFGMMPGQLWSARAVSHALVKSADALHLHDTGEKAMLRNRSAVHLRRLQYINKMHALAPTDPHTAVSGTLNVLHSTAEQTEQVHRDRAAWMLSALPEWYASAEKLELIHILHAPRKPLGAA